MGVQVEPPAVAGAEESRPFQGRIPFRLRIGVTGHRTLPEGDGLHAAVGKAIGLAISESGYPGDGLSDTPLRLTVVSALAEGADRLVAKEVLSRNTGENRLVCVLPVPDTPEGRDIYRADFASEPSRHEFDDLYQDAWQRLAPPAELVPPNATQEQRNAGYLWAGQEVVRNSDVVIVIWDGQPPRGEGGTADLIHRMRDDDIGRSRSGSSQAARPRPDRPRPARDVLASALFGTFEPQDSVLPAQRLLRIIVSTNPDHTPVVDDGPPWDVAARAARDRIKADLSRIDEFNKKTYPAADWQRSAERLVNELVPAEYRQSPRLNRIVEQIAPPLNRADQAAMAAQRAFVWSSYGLFGCTALATIIAAVQAVVFPGLWELTIGELVLLAASVGIVYAERIWKNNNKHWFVYRFLAERLRSACYLLAVGCVPETDFDVGGTAEEPAQNDWVRRAFTAVLAEGEIRQQDILEDPETLSSLIRGHWIGGQVNYFDRASKKLMRKHSAVRRLLYGVLGATMVAAVLHSLRIWPFHSGSTQALVMCAIGLPAVAGALSNIRSIREFSRHSFRYARMSAVLRRYMDRFNTTPDINDLGRLAVDVDELLTAETGGWLVEVSARGLEIHG